MFINSYSLSKAYAFVLALVLLGTRMYAQNVGIGTALPNTGLDVVRDLALREAAAVTIAGNLINSGSSSHVRVTNTGTINQILNPQNGKVLYLINASGGTIVLANNTPPLSSDKIFTGSGANYSLPDGATAHLIYNATNQAWQLVGVSPGAAAAASTGWLLTGNVLTNPAVNFVGTTDCNSLRFRVNNQFSGLIECTATNGNTAFGYNTMANPTASGAIRNVAIGDSVLGALTNGGENVGIGYRALASNTTGNSNIAVGSQALWSNTTGFGNVAIGHQTLRGNTIGYSNVANGWYALRNNTSGYENVAIGNSALQNNTTGIGNVATGAAALALNTIGSNNVASGLQALLKNTDGNNNVATGFWSLFWNTTGNDNVATGPQALYFNTTGNNNVATGPQALFSNVNGSSNVAAGRNALYYNITGWQNTAVGDSAGFGNSSGTKNTYLGYAASADASNYINSTAIGANAQVGASNVMVLGSINGINGATANTNVGIGTTIPNTALDIARDLALRAVPITPPTGIVHNYDLNTNRASLYVITALTGPVTFTGFTGGVDGRIVTLHNNSGQNITINNMAIGSSFLNRVLTGTGGGITIPDNGTVTIQYDITNTRWFVVSTQGNTMISMVNAWNLTGNAATNPAVNFVGTTDCNSLRFRVNNQFSGLIECAANNGNTAFGYNTMANPTAVSALRNVAIGDSVLGALNPVNPWEGNDNTGIGYRALASNTTGFGNTAVGSQALWSNTTGESNTATGYYAMYSNTGGGGNIATGYYAMYSNTGGTNNVATGYYAMYSNTGGNNNVATGSYALYSNTTGESNVAAGLNALHDNTTGFSNVAAGTAALYSNTTGFSNIAAGRNALYGTSSGWQNTAVGDSAGYTNTTGTGNTYLGYRADANADNYTNSTAIGAGAIVYADNSMMFGNTAVTNWSFGRNTPPTSGYALEVGTHSGNGNGAYLTTGGVWTDISDRNLKTNITNLSGAEILAKIGQLPITRWTYKGTNETHIGPMAQDFYRLFNVGLDSVSISTVDPSGVALIGIQELKRQVETLQSENSALNKEVANMRRENAQQQQENAELKALNTKFEARLKLLEDRAGIKAEK